MAPGCCLASTSGRLAMTTLRPAPRHRSSTTPRAGLRQQKCEPCEAAQDALDAMGLTMTMSLDAAEGLLSELDARWRLATDAEGRLRLRRVARSRNFVKGLELFRRIAEVAEAEGHHPDLHLEGWNTCTVELWTHARQGLSDNDFIVAAKLDPVFEAAAGDLLSKKQPALD